MIWLLPLGIMLGWYAREMRDLLRLTKKKIVALRQDRLVDTTAGIIRGGEVYQGGKRNTKIIDLPDADPGGAIVRSPSPLEVRKENDRNFKEDLAAGKFSGNNQKSA